MYRRHIVHVFLYVYNTGANKVLFFEGKSVKVRISNKLKLRSIGSYSWRDNVYCIVSIVLYCKYVRTTL